ncbi:MAG: anthranilate synthase component I [Oscillospiraceae bacterium]|nr:anthranilate synthase component I [Oscillospiraceae bacterium]
MLKPSLSEVKELLETRSRLTHVPVVYERLCDAVTPVRIFEILSKNAENAFILESVSNDQQWQRYSFIGINPKAELAIKNKKGRYTENGETREFEVTDLSAFFKELMKSYNSPALKDGPGLTGGFVGYFGYDTIRYIEPKLSNPPADDLNIPDINLCLYEELVAFDHLSNKVLCIFNITRGDEESKYSLAEAKAEKIVRAIESYVPAPKPYKDIRPIQVKSNITREQYLSNVEKSKEYIRKGDIFQIVPSQRFEVDTVADPYDVYRMLRSTNPSPYLYFFKHPEYNIAGASPEKLLSVTDGICMTKPIAGTIRRGETPEDDMANEKRLINDPKERAEHTMLVDLGRNDIGKVSEFGSVHVENLMHIERYSRIMHIVSDVYGKLKSDKTPIDALMSVLPAGTLSGAPKIRAMEIIDELETTQRGLYGGTVGYLAFDGNIDTCIAIRTVLFRHGKAYVQAGGGVVADSEPENEFNESKNKAYAMIKAIEMANEI